MPKNLWQLYTSLGEDEFRVLRAIERFQGRHEYVPVELVEKASGLPPSRLQRALAVLSRNKLIKRRLGNFSGYTLTFLGLDVLALRNLVKRGVVSLLGDKIGIGKEGDVYIAVAPDGSRLVVKFHREGRKSFRKVWRHRSFTLNLEASTWLEVAKYVGEREFKALVSLWREGARVPEPVAWNRHAVVQRYVEGVELSEAPEMGEEEALSALRDVIETVRIAYQRVGIVHGDLSEYNILVEPAEGRAYVIDWPQYVYKDEPHADELLRRDVEYVARFFRRKYRVEVDVEEALAYVRGERGEPPW